MALSGRLYCDEILVDDESALPEESGAAESYWRAIPAIRQLLETRRLRFDAPVTLLVGENGCGKSTLLEAIAVAFGLNAEGGSRNFRFATCATHSRLGERLRYSRLRRPRDSYFLRAESFYNVITEIDRLDREPGSGAPIIAGYGWQSLHACSHGEAFWATMKNRFRGEGFYLLDEPEAALSPSRQLALLGMIRKWVERDSQLIVATHSPILMGYPGARLLLLDGSGIRPVRYEETEHYAITRAFLEHPERLLAELGF